MNRAASTQRLSLRGCLAFAAVLFIGCGSTKFVSTWSAPDQGAITFQKLAVVCLSSDKIMRRTVEDTLVSQIAQTKAVPSYSFVPDEELDDVDKVKRRVVAAGHDGALTMRLVAIEKERTRVSTGGAYPHSYGRHGFSGYYHHGWGTAYHSTSVQVDTVAKVETHLYSLSDEKLIWAGLSKTFNPRSPESAVKEIARAVGRDLRKRGLIPKEE